MTDRTALKVFTAHKQLEGGGFTVRRSVGSLHMDTQDPFLLLDHFGPVEVGPHEAVGAPDHPHRGFETVTYMLQGSFQHLDNAGNSGTLSDGWVQWMTAGRGVVHSEMPGDDLFENGGRQEGFQLWVNLPAKSKMVPPRYQDTPPEKIPKRKTDDGNVEVVIIAGEAMNTKAVIDTHTPISYLDFRLQPGASFVQSVPADYNGFVYVYRGKGTFGANKANAAEGQYFALGKGDQLSFSAAPDSSVHFLLIAGVPLNEPVARYGPFVMNTRQEIIQAIKDYQDGKFGGPIPGAEERARRTELARRNQKRSQGSFDDDSD